MNTAKQINLMVALVFIAVLATGAYTMWDPSRASDAKADDLRKTVDRGAFLFSQNCATCHGDRGEGGAAANRLKLALPLNRPDLQGIDPQTGKVNAQDKASKFNLIVNTITCGRVGKSMPTWGQSQGGTLNDEQIRQLATMITEGTAWDTVAEYAIFGDEKHHYTGYASAGIKVARPLDATATTVYLSSLGPLSKGSRIEIDGELMLVTASPEKNLQSVTVQRNLGTTKAAEHQQGAAVRVPPVPPDPPPVTQPACGQNLPAAAPAATGPATASTDLTLVAQGLAFDTATLLGVAGQPLTITYDNRDAGVPHNLHVFKGKDATGADVALSDIKSGPVTETLKLGPLDAGDYYYRCDVHPTTMEGILTTAAAGAAPAAPATGTTPAADATPAAGTTPAASTTPAAGATPAASATP
jgi:mono/diheme cytochrome c family protein/plastocyanin